MAKRMCYSSGSAYYLRLAEAETYMGRRLPVRVRVGSRVYDNGKDGNTVGGGPAGWCADASGGINRRLLACSRGSVVFQNDSPGRQDTAHT